MRKSIKESVTLHLGPFHGEKLLMTRSLGGTLPFTVKIRMGTIQRQGNGSLRIPHNH